MGSYKHASRDLRQTKAHLDLRGDGVIYGVYNLDFKKDASRFEYCFMGGSANTLTFDGKEIEKHPKFKGVEQFEGWCRKYVAEHDI